MKWQLTANIAFFGLSAEYLCEYGKLEMILICGCVLGAMVVLMMPTLLAGHVNVMLLNGAPFMSLSYRHG